MKEYTIIETRYRHGEYREKEWKGTLEQLTKAFGYTLECGKSWEHERGNKKINIHPKSGRSLVDNLNKVVSNLAANGCASVSYALVE